MSFSPELKKALSLQQSGQLAEAIAAYSAILQKDSKNADALHLLGLCFYQVGDFPRSANMLSQAVQLQPKSALYLANFGLALVQLNQLAAAEQASRQAIQHEPNHAPAYVSLGMALSRAGFPEEAEKAYRDCLHHDPDNPDALNNMSMVLRDLRRHEEALEFGQKALAQNENFANHNNVGNIFNDLGKLDLAKQHYEKSIALKQDYGQAWSNWAHIIRFGVEEYADEVDRLPELEKLAHNTAIIPADRGHLLFALAKATKDQGQFEKAFPLYEEANDLLTPTPFPFDHFNGYTDSIREAQTKEKLDSLPDSGSEQAPVFIVGMLRSGTSLTEQILSVHPAFGGVGESKEIALLTHKLGKEYPTMEGVDSAKLDSLAAHYYDRIGDFFDPPERPVDKMMTNFLHLGLIAKVFPNAKIIHLNRHAYDVCLSCFFQNFAAIPAWTANLEGTAKYYAIYEEMMAHWKQELPLEIFDLHYEKLVADPEPTIRAMLEYLEADWDPVCLDYQKSKRPVQTASNWQVRQPLHTGSIGNWKRYDRFLNPLREILGDRG